MRSFCFSGLVLVLRLWDTMFVSKLIVSFQLLGSLSFVLGLVLGLPVIQVGFNDRTISKVEADMLQIAEHSWELGTACEAEAELASPALSVFRASAFPPPTHLNPAITGNSTAMIDIATKCVLFLIIILRLRFSNPDC